MKHPTLKQIQDATMRAAHYHGTTIVRDVKRRYGTSLARDIPPSKRRAYLNDLRALDSRSSKAKAKMAKAVKRWQRPCKAKAKMAKAMQGSTAYVNTNSSKGGDGKLPDPFGNAFGSLSDELQSVNDVRGAEDSIAIARRMAEDYRRRFPQMSELWTPKLSVPIIVRQELPNDVAQELAHQFLCLLVQGRINPLKGE